MKNKYYDVSAVREAIHAAPVPSISTPFLKNGEIDYKSLATYTDFLVESGAKALLLTPGDSHFAVLGDEEQLEVNRVVVDACNHRAMVIGAADRMYYNRMVEFAEKYRDFGGDLLIPFAPDWCSYTTDDTLLEYYKACGKVAPTMLLSCNCGGLSNRIYDSVGPENGIVAVKDDKALPYGTKALPHIRDKMAYLSGGRMETFLYYAPYGADGYLAVFARAFPDVDKRFWSAYNNGDLAGAVKIIEDYEIAFFDWCSANGVHWDSGIRGMIEIAGLAPRYTRHPFTHITDEQIEKLRQFLKEKKVI